MYKKTKLLFNVETGNISFEDRDVFFPFFPFEFFAQSHWWLTYGVPLKAITAQGEIAYYLRLMEQSESDFFLRTNLPHLFDGWDLYADFRFVNRSLHSVCFHPKTTDTFSFKIHQECRIFLRWLNRMCKPSHRFKLRKIETHLWIQPSYLIDLVVDESSNDWRCTLTFIKS